jgi:DNA-damage-inducible protein J
MTQNVTIRMNSELKRQAEVLFHEMGLNMSTAITIFVRQSVWQRKIPFEITAPEPVVRAGYTVPLGEEDDPFYSEKNLRHLQASIKELEAEKAVIKPLKTSPEMEK